MSIENVNPLENLVSDGGFVGIFRTIGCIGDSLSSGEFQSTKEDGSQGFHDMYEYSWGQYMAREAGCTVYNFSRGGMSAKWFNESFEQQCGIWTEEKKCQAYVIALGVNDVMNQNQTIGEVGDCEKEGYADNRTYSGEYEIIIKKIKDFQPKARIFLMTIPDNGEFGDPSRREKGAKVQKLLSDFCDKYEFTYLIDLYKYAPKYDAEFRDKYFLAGHMNPMGYMIHAKFVTTYIDYIIRNNMEDFKQVAFIGTQWHSDKAKW
ncbi:MAG: SGNH/GDSL hydrolase family protein [Clostridia bacterium]|nr:SGNH/GDSL hydrolase family protein [Clostridia bacterium]